jgi:hypothetical protein
MAMHNKPSDRAAREWLHRSAANVAEDEEQRRLHAAAAECLGAFAGGDPRRAERGKQAIRTRLRRRYGAS